MGDWTNNFLAKLMIFLHLFNSSHHSPHSFQPFVEFGKWKWWIMDIGKGWEKSLQHLKCKLENAGVSYVDERFQFCTLHLSCSFYRDFNYIYKSILTLMKVIWVFHHNINSVTAWKWHSIVFWMISALMDIGRQSIWAEQIALR